MPSEFFSGIATAAGQARLRALKIRDRLDSRRRLSMDQYEDVLARGDAVRFGTRNVTLGEHYPTPAPGELPRPTLFLRQIKEYHREYEWIG